MPRSNLIALGGNAAMVAGFLRAIAAFVPGTTSQPLLQTLYLATDLFILLGVIGLFFSKHDHIGMLGFAGFIATITGILVIRSAGAFSGANLYPLGSLLLLVGLIALGVSLRRSGTLSSWIVGAWCSSLLLGIAAAAFATVNLLLIAAGLSFAVGFFGAGYELRLAARK